MNNYETRDEIKLALVFNFGRHVITLNRKL